MVVGYHKLVVRGYIAFIWWDYIIIIIKTLHKYVFLFGLFSPFLCFIVLVLTLSFLFFLKTLPNILGVFIHVYLIVLTTFYLIINESYILSIK